MPLGVDARTLWGRPTAAALVGGKCRLFSVLTFSSFLDPYASCFPPRLTAALCLSILQVHTGACRHSHGSSVFLPGMCSVKVTACPDCPDCWAGERQRVPLPAEALGQRLGKKGESRPGLSVIGPNRGLVLKSLLPCRLCQAPGA